MSYDTQRIGRNVNEMLVLAALRKGPLHGYQIAVDVERRCGGEFELQHGTLYPILHRLEKEGLIEGEWTEEGRRRKEYHLTGSGRSRLQERASRLHRAVKSLFDFVTEATDGDLSLGHSAS